MRQDPDVILIGEIRDRETAEIAIQASLTGHLVLSTLHTNDAASAVTRLVDIGIAPHKIATAVKGVLAQRLLRRLCESCREPRAARPDEIRRGVPEGHAIGQAAGCEACGDTGYRGRLAIVEVLAANADVERLIAAGETAERIAAAARASGMGSLWESGLTHVLAGETTLDELLRIAELPSGGSRPPVVSPSQRSPAVHYIGGVTEIAAGTVDAYVIRPLHTGWQVLVLQRSPDTRCPGAWETVHGRLEPREQPEDGALREIHEETGLEPERLYVITVQPYYLKPTSTVQLAVVFAAFVREPANVVLGPEHQRYEWLDIDDARIRFAWPRERAALDEIVALLSGGDAGPVEDVLRIR
jgi:8-oxo-dGTP pyrophosphatase MutT (NUDIX family)